MERKRNNFPISKIKAFFTLHYLQFARQQPSTLSVVENRDFHEERKTSKENFRVKYSGEMFVFLLKITNEKLIQVY